MLLLLLWALLALSLHAQTPAFKAARDLEGFEGVELSEHRDVYDLASFRELDGKPLTAEELEAQRKRWKAEWERGNAYVAKLESDPAELWSWNLRRRLLRHRYFSKISWTLERPAPGFVLVVQRPAKDDPKYIERLAALYIPSASTTFAQFEKEILTPTGLQRRKGHELTAIAVLASQGDLDNFRKFVNDPTGYTSATAYDYELQLTVACQDPFTEVSPPVQQAAMNYQLIKALQHAYLAVPGNRPASIGLYEGLAMYYGSLREGKATPKPESAGWLLDAVNAAETRELLLLPLDQWMQISSWQDYAGLVAKRAEAAQQPVPEGNQIGRAYMAQCERWPHFLMQAADGRYRLPFLTFAGSALRGKGKAADLQTAFPGIDPRAVSREFLLAMCAEAAKRNPKAKFDPKAIESMFPAPVHIDAGPVVEGPQVEEQVAEFAPQALAPEAGDVQAVHALALSRAREGDFTGALDELRGVLVGAVSPAKERLERELLRLEQLHELRNGWLRAQIAAKGRIKVAVRGKEFFAPIVAIDNGLVRLGENGGGVGSVALREVVWQEAVKAATKPEQQGNARPWTRAFGLLLAGDERWEKQLKSRDAEVEALVKDAPSYAALKATSEVARSLYLLSRNPIPRTSAEIDQRLGEVKRLLNTYGTDPLLQRRIDLLRQYATACLLERLRSTPTGVGLHGKLTDLGDGRVRIEYSFDAEGELSDWVQVPREFMPVKPSGSATGGSVSAYKGILAGTGNLYLRFPRVFQGDVSVRYFFHFKEPSGAYVAPRLLWIFGETADGNYAACDPMGDIYVRYSEPEDSRSMRPKERAPLDWNQDAEIGIELKSGVVTTSFNGKPVATLENVPVKGGSMGLFTEMDLTFAVSRIVLEGRLDARQDASQRNALIADELRKLGFP